MSEPVGKVLFVGPLPPPPGGGETVTRALLRSDLARRYQLVHCDTSRRLGVDRSGRLDAANWVNAGRQWCRFVRLLATERPRLVHMPIAGNIPGLMRDHALVTTAAAFGIPVIGHVHGGTLIRLYGRPSRATRTLIHGVFRRLAATIALSPSLAEFFLANDLAQECTVVSNPVDPEFLEAMQQSKLRRSGVQAFRRSGGSPDILFIGAVGRRKGVFDLVEALPEVRRSVPGVRMRVVGPAGTPGVLGELAELVRGRGLEECIHFDGPLFGASKVEAFLQADVVVLPSYDEQFPCVLLEAMAAGRPVVTTAVGGIPDMVRHGKEGFVLTPGDIAGLTQALVELADPGIRQSMGASGAARVAAEYRIDTAVERISALYEEVGRRQTPDVRGQLSDVRNRTGRAGV